MRFLIVQSGGFSERMIGQKTNLPKCLHTFGNKTFIAHQVERYTPDCVFVILSPEHEPWRSFINGNFGSTIVEETKGDLAGLSAAFDRVRDEIEFYVEQGEDEADCDSRASETHEIIITWSDVLVSEHHKRGVYLSNNPDKSRVKINSLGFFGMIHLDNDDMDMFEDAIKNESTVTETSLQKMIKALACYHTVDDAKVTYLGTKEELIEASRQLSLLGWSKAKVTRHGTKIEKTMKSFERLILGREHAWLEKVYPGFATLRPYSIEMEYLEDKNVSFEEAMDEIKRIHLQKDPVEVSPLFLREYFKKSIETNINFRLKNFGIILDSYPNIILNSNVNLLSTDLDEISRRLNTLLSYFFSKCSLELVFSHGDPTYSNAFKKNGKVYLLDPRISKDIFYYHVPEYDYAKLFYSYHGKYDKITNSVCNDIEVLFKQKEIYIKNPYLMSYDEAESHYLQTPHACVSMLLLPALFISLGGMISNVTPKEAMIAFACGVYYLDIVEKIMMKHR